MKVTLTGTEIDLENREPLEKRRKEGGVRLLVPGTAEPAHLVTAELDLVTICNKNELFAHEPTTGDKSAVDGVVDSSMLKQN
ncbi:hypothetical protein TYRP_021920, partial [Tyrophagus putrescentiae]